MQVFRQKVLEPMTVCHPLMVQVIRSLQSLELMLLSDKQCSPQAFYDIVNNIRQHEDIFPEWHASSTAELYSPPVFKNKKSSSAFWF